MWSKPNVPPPVVTTTSATPFVTQALTSLNDSGSRPPQPHTTSTPVRSSGNVGSMRGRVGVPFDQVGELEPDAVVVDDQHGPAGEVDGFGRFRGRDLRHEADQPAR